MRSRSSSKKLAELKDKENNLPVQPAEEVKSEPEVKENVNENSTENAQPEEAKATSDAELQKAFNCSKCHIKLKDVKLLKLHYWRVHIGENDIVKANRMLQLSGSNMNAAQERLLDSQSQKSGADLSADAKAKQGQAAVLHFLKADSSTPNRKRKHRKSTTSTEIDVGALLDGNSAKKRPVVSDSEDVGSSADSKSDVLDEKTGQESADESESDLEKQNLEEKLMSLTDEEIKYFNLSEDIDEANVAERAEALNLKSGSKASKKSKPVKLFAQLNLAVP